MPENHDGVEYAKPHPVFLNERCIVPVMRPSSENLFGKYRLTMSDMPIPSANR
jgi:hypothetical protein